MTEELVQLEGILSSPIFDWAIKGILIYTAIFWIALVVWVTRDVINRTNNLFFQIMMIALNIILPIFGLVVYLVIRPNKTLVEKYYEEIEYRALAEGAEQSLLHCPKCGTEIERDFTFCPNCANELRKPCGKCKRLIDVKYKLCPYCGTTQEKKSKK